MIKQLSLLLCNYVSGYLSLENKEKEIYCYCIEQVISKVLFYFCLILFGLLTQRLVAAVLFLFSFVHLKSFGGGGHAATKNQCTFLSYGISFLTIFFTPIICNYIPDILLFLFYFFSIIYPILKAPIDTKNKRFVGKQRQYLRLKFLLFLLLQTAIFSVLYFLNLKSFYGILSICAIIFVISFFIGELQNRKDS